MLVHNRLENDPRVSRHARAAVAAGYRVAVLSVGVHGAWQPRWGEPTDGVMVYESQIVRVSLLGRARAALQRRTIAWSGASATPEVTPGPVGEAPGKAGVRASLLQAGRDLMTIGMLVRNNIGVFRQFRGIGARLVHANDLNVLLAGYLLARAWRAPLLYDSHELWTQLDEGWSPLLRRLFALLEGPLLRRADAVVTVNAPIARELAQAYAAPMPIVVMNCPELQPSADRQEVASAVSVDDIMMARGQHGRLGATAAARSPGLVKPGTGLQSLSVIYQGMLNYRGRGLEGLIDAAAQVEGATLSLRGPGSLAGALQRRIDDLGAGNVRILPPVPMADLVTALDGYDVGVISYLPIGRNFLFCSPNKLFEYMMAGLAVVCSDLPVLREVVVSAECGLLYEAGDVESLAQALRRLAEDRELLARYKANARRAARERYNAAIEEGRLLEVYSRLLAAPRNRRRGGTG